MVKIRQNVIFVTMMVVCVFLTVVTVLSLQRYSGVSRLTKHASLFSR